MVKRIALLGLILSNACGLAAPQTQSKKIVAWDIHGVLCSEKKGKHGYQCIPHESTFELIKELQSKGVKVVILSNISRRSFCKLCKCYPGHFKQFDISRSLADAEGIFTRKPHKKYYKKFLKKNRDTRPSDIIFLMTKQKTYTELESSASMDSYSAVLIKHVLF